MDKLSPFSNHLRTMKGGLVPTVLSIFCLALVVLHELPHFTQAQCPPAPCCSPCDPVYPFNSVKGRRKRKDPPGIQVKSPEPPTWPVMIFGSYASLGHWLMSLRGVDCDSSMPSNSSVGRDPCMSGRPSRYDRNASLTFLILS